MLTRRSKKLVWVGCAVAAMAAVAMTPWVLQRSSATDSGVVLLVTEPVTRGTVESLVRQRGILRSADTEPVVVGTHGFIQFIVDQGTLVKKGDLVLAMDDTDPREDLERYQDSVEGELLSSKVGEENLAFTTYREEQNLALNDAVLAQARLEETEELKQPTDEALRLLAIDARLAELDLAEAEDNYAGKLRLFKKDFVSKTALEPFERRVAAAKAYVEEVKRSIEIARRGVSEERRVELRTAVQRAEAVGGRARRRMERRVRQIQENLETSKLRVRSAEHQMLRDQREISRAEVRATRDGVVMVRQYRDWRSGGKSREYKAGVEKYPQDIVADIIDPRSMTIEMVVNEADFHGLREGMPVRVEMPAFPGKVFAGRLNRLGALGQDRNLVDPTGGGGGASEIIMFTAGITFEGDGTQFRPGMSAQVSIVVDRRENVVHVPRSAVRRQGEGWQAHVARGEASEWVPVEGSIFDERVFLVDSGLSEVDKVVVGQEVRNDG